MPRSCQFKTREFAFDSATTFRKNPSRRFVSLEFEGADGSAYPEAIQWTTSTGVVVRGTVLDKLCADKRWTVKPDGTIGVSFEINTRPMNGDLIFENVEKLTTAVKAVGAKATKACGGHVHVDARDLDYAAIMRVAKVWTKIEPMMFAMASRKREGNRYCQPFRRIATTTFAAPTPQQQFGRAVSNGRFFALNLCSYTMHKTLEVRLMHSNVDRTLFAHWMAMLAQLVDWAKAATDAQIAALPEDAEAALRQVVPGSAGFINRRLEVQVWRWQRARLDPRVAFVALARFAAHYNAEVTQRSRTFAAALASVAEGVERVRDLYEAFGSSPSQQPARRTAAA